MIENNISFPVVSTTGTLIHVAYDNEYLGNIIIKDEIRPNSEKLIKYLNKAKIKTIMLTGDNKVIAENIAKEVGIDKVYSELLPSGKVEHLFHLFYFS